MANNPHIGSTFSSFLAEKGVPEESRASAFERDLIESLNEAVAHGHGEAARMKVAGYALEDSYNGVFGTDGE